MFWRFGFHACSAIDTLLDKPDVTLEEILGEDDLLQECKAHNTKLIEYLRDPNILSKLLNYIIADDQIDDKAKFKYSYISCEVLSCEIWSICETVVQNRELLSNFWAFLDRPSPVNPLQASYFTKVNEQFLEKKTDEMIPFIQSIPDIVPKLLRHIETSAIMDLLLKIISMEKSEPGAGIVEWLHDEGLIPALLTQMNPHIEPEIQGTVADVLKAIIAISANSSDAGVIGPNALSRELVSETTISKTLDYMLDPDAPHSTASLTNGVSLIIELIRKNNSDYDLESVLNLTLKSHPPTSRDPIYLGTMLRLFASRIPDFQKLLVKPKSVPSSIVTTFGPIEPLGFERFRICELYAELLHCSNMILLNDPRGEQVVKERDEERERLRLEGEAKPAKPDLWGDVDLNRGKEWIVPQADSEGGIIIDPKNDPSDGLPGIQQPLEQTQVSSASQPDNSFVTSNRSSEASDSQSSTEPKSGPRGYGHGATDRKGEDLRKQDISPDTTRTFDSADSVSTPIDHDGAIPSPNAIRKPVVGDYLKMQFVEAKVLPAVVDLFFAHPWNNFLHNVVYDILTQVLNGPMDHGFNRQLVVDLFTTGQLTEKILQGQIASDEAQAKDKGVRLGYMGHLTLISEEVLKLAERIPLDLLDPVVVQILSSPAWNEYVDTTLTATRTRDNAILGGVRPQSTPLSGINASLLGTTPSELVDDSAVLAAIVNRGLRYENGTESHGSDDFEEDAEDRDAQEEPFVRYMSQSLTNDLPDKFGSSDEDDDDEEVVGWIGDSGEFEGRTQEQDEFEDDEEDEGDEFGRRGLFQQRWDGNYHGDEFVFRGIESAIFAGKPDTNSSDDEENGDDEFVADRIGRAEQQSSGVHDLAESIGSLHLQNHHETAISTNRKTADSTSALPDVNQRPEANDEELFEQAGSESKNALIHAESDLLEPTK